MTDYNAMSLDEMYGELETRWFDSIHEADEMEREAQRRSAVVTALCHLAADLDAEGLVVVPREPTWQMLVAAGATPNGATPRGGVDWLGGMLPRYWRAMLTAAPLAPEVG